MHDDYESQALVSRTGKGNGHTFIRKTHDSFVGRREKGERLL
jgi:hypothetical protein